MTATQWVIRAVSALLALALLFAAFLVIAEIVAAATGHGPWLVSYAGWPTWMRGRSWDDAGVMAILAGVVVVGLLVLFLGLRRGKPATLRLRARTPGVTVRASRKSVERSLAAAAARTSGITGAEASIRRRSARIEARAGRRSAAGLRQAVESASGARLESLQLARNLHPRVRVHTKDGR